MKPILFSTLLVASAAVGTANAELLFSDNFDTFDQRLNDELPPIAARVAGTVSSETLLTSHRAHQQLQGGMLAGVGTAGFRFENTTIGGAADRYDWATGLAGGTILAAGGFTVEFDWIPLDAAPDPTQWVAWAVGTPNADSGASVVNEAANDYGVLFRVNGGTERFDNGSNLGAGGSFVASPDGVSRHVLIRYEFDSFADGSDVTATSSVDGVVVATDTFQWDSNGGALHMEFATNNTGSLIDNVEVNTLDVAGLIIGFDGGTFRSSVAGGTEVGLLSARVDGTAEAATFALVPGDGDADNELFQISGDALQTAAGADFLGEPDGTTYSVRIRGTGDVTGAEGEQIVVLTLLADDDGDDLPDVWELAATDFGDGGNLDDLSGLGGADFDNDDLSDLEEFVLNEQGLAVSPLLDDTDLDDLKDGEELAGAGDRPPTDPTNFDTDGDWIEDGRETNTGVFASADDTGSDPTEADSDFDGFRDYFDTLHGGDPNDPGVVPVAGPSVSFVPLEEDGSSGIDPTKSYTHAISGGGEATVNGVTFETLTPAIIPPNFEWDSGGFGMNEVAAINNGDWDPSLGGVTGPGLLDLLGGFVYSSDGANPGSLQSYWLSGLTPGQSYTLRLYVRLWDTDGSGRPINLSFENGGDVVFAPVLEDRPAITLDGGSEHAAYAIEFRYTAADSELFVNAEVPFGSAVPSGSYHLYGLSNEVGSAAPAPGPVITSVSRDPVSGEVTIVFDSDPEGDYAIDVSTAIGKVGNRVDGRCWRTVSRRKG